MADEPQSKSDLYASRQGLFDARFTEIIVKTFVGFERTLFDQLEQNDDAVSETGPSISITWYGAEAVELMEDLECGHASLPEGTSMLWSDGTPLPQDPEDY